MQQQNYVTYIYIHKYTSNSQFNGYWQFTVDRK